MMKVLNEKSLTRYCTLQLDQDPQRITVVLVVGSTIVHLPRITARIIVDYIVSHFIHLIRLRLHVTKLMTFIAPSSPSQQQRKLLYAGRGLKSGSVDLPDEVDKSLSSASTSPCPSPVRQSGVRTVLSHLAMYS